MNKIIAILLSFAVISITGCNQGGGTTVAGAAPSVSALSLSTTQITVNSDNSNSATITATVLDSSNAAMEAVTVNFSSTGGQLSTASAVTNALGQAQILFSSGSLDPSNKTVTITAAVGAATSTIPIQVTGSTVAYTILPTTLNIGQSSDNATVTVVATNAGGVPVAGTTVALGMTGTGTATLTSASGTTLADGTFTTTITATATATAGVVTLTAFALGASASQDYTVAGAGSAFQITAPVTNPTSIAINASLPVDVDATTVATNVVFVTSHGTWGATGSNIITVAGGGTATANISATTGGTASIMVFDEADTSISDSMTVYVTNSVVSGTDTIAVSATPTTVPISSGGILYTSAIIAVVEDEFNQPVSNAAVVFNLSNVTGGGESINPPFALTGLDGVATTTFTSGSLGTDSGGIDLTATLYDAANAFVADDTIPLVMNSLPGSVVIGTSTAIASDPTDTFYILPMAVQVANSAGGPVAGAVVTLRVWPKSFITGQMGNVPTCGPAPSGTFPNEDINRSLVLDAGEDLFYDEAVEGDLNLDGDTNDFYGYDENIDGIDHNGDTDTVDQLGDGLITPHNSAGGTVPQTVTTDANGIATFELTYLKSYSRWIEDEITATTTVTGTETAGTLTMVLGYAETDCEALGPSPFNPTPWDPI